MHAFSDKLNSFLISQAVIWAPLLIAHQLRRHGAVHERIAKPLHAINLSCITPVVYGLGVWRLDRSAPGWVWVPVAMALGLALMTALGVWASFRYLPHRHTAGTFALMLSISNTGHTMAGFLTLLLLSDAGYSYNSLLMIPMIIFVSMVWFPLARHWGHPDGQPFLDSFRQALFSGQSFQLVGLLAGGVLNYARVPMNGFWILMLKAMVFGGTVLVMFAMGLRLRFRRLGGRQRLLGWAYAAKFAVSPLLMIALCWLFGLRGVAAGAVFIAAIAPVGVNSVSFSTLFDLDIDLANAGYLWSTFIFMAFVLPFVIWILHAPLFR